MVETNVGEELIRLGWRQGSLLQAKSAQKSWLVLETAKEKDEANPTVLRAMWKLQQANLDENDYLIIASQTCDIARPSEQEPYVEVLRAYWTAERKLIHQAGKNSVRNFLLQRRTIAQGKEEGLIADATIRVQIEKAAFLSLIPILGFKENDNYTPRRFRQWLAKRYDRQALDDELVNAVQKPIVKAIDKLHKTDALHRVLDGLSEILFMTDEHTRPYQIDMLFIRDERKDAPVVSDEDAANLAGWIKNLLRRGGNAELFNWDILSTKNISAYDYANAYELPTDQFSLTNEDGEID